MKVLCLFVVFLLSCWCVSAMACNNALCDGVHCAIEVPEAEVLAQCVGGACYLNTAVAQQITETRVVPMVEHRTYELKSVHMSQMSHQASWRVNVIQRRQARWHAWFNRPGLFGWRMRAGLCR